MNKAQYNSFLMGILGYLIYNNIFGILLSLNDVLLFNFHLKETIYVSCLVIAILLTNGILYVLYSYYVNTVLSSNRIIITSAILLSAIILISMGVNYYLSHFDYSTIILQEEYNSTEIYRQYYEMRGIIYFLNSLILMIILLMGLKRKNKRNLD